MSQPPLSATDKPRPAAVPFDAARPSDVARSVTISWADQTALGARSRTMDGLSFMQALIRGEIPPPAISTTMGIFPVEVEKGRVLFEARPGEHHYNPIGSIHGGWTATIVDTVASCAVHTMLELGQAFSTTTLTTHFLRPISLQTGLIRAEGRLLNIGRTFGLGEARITDGAGKLLAHGTAACAIFPVPPGSVPAG